MSEGFQGISRRFVNFASKGRRVALLSMPLSRKTRQLIPVNYFLFTSASARVSLTPGSSVSARNEKLFLRGLPGPVSASANFKFQTHGAHTGFSINHLDSYGPSVSRVYEIK